MPTESLPLFLTMFGIPGASALPPVEIPGPSIVDEVVGSGRPFMPGRQVTFHYVVTNAAGKVLASSEVRGIGFTAAFGKDLPPGKFIESLIGIRAGGTRRFWAHWEDLSLGGDRIASSFDEVTVRVRAISVGAATMQR